MSKLDKIGSWVMTLAAIVEIVAAFIGMRDWRTAWFAFAAAWFAWMVVYERSKVPNAEVS